MARYNFSVSVLLECIQYAAENESITAIDLNMSTGDMEVQFVISQDLVAKFSDSCEPVE